MGDTYIDAYKTNITNATVNLVLTQIVKYLRTHRQVEVTVEELSGSDCLGLPYQNVSVQRTQLLSSGNISTTPISVAPKKRQNTKEVFGACQRTIKARGGKDARVCGKDITKEDRTLCNTCNTAEETKKKKNEGKTTGLKVDDKPRVNMSAVEFDGELMITQNHNFVFNTNTLEVLGKCINFPEDKVITHLSSSDKVLANEMNLKVPTQIASLPKINVPALPQVHASTEEVVSNGLPQLPHEQQRYSAPQVSQGLPQISVPQMPQGLPQISVSQMPVQVSQGLPQMPVSQGLPQITVPQMPQGLPQVSQGLPQITVSQMPVIVQ